MRGFLSRVAHRVSRTAQEVDDAELVRHTEAVGATTARELEDRRVAAVSGEVRSLTLPPSGRVPALVAELYDGTGAITLVWLGRREIRGIVPGARLRAQGRVAYRKGVPTIFNPQYELIATPHGG